MCPFSNPFPLSFIGAFDIHRNWYNGKFSEVTLEFNIIVSDS